MAMATAQKGNKTNLVILLEGPFLGSNNFQVRLQSMSRFLSQVGTRLERMCRETAQMPGSYTSSGRIVGEGLSSRLRLQLVG